MKKLMAAATVVSVAFFSAFVPMADAQSACPPEVTKAKEMARWITAQRNPAKALWFILELIRAVLKGFNQSATDQQRTYQS